MTGARGNGRWVLPLLGVALFGCTPDGHLVDEEIAAMEASLIVYSVPLQSDSLDFPAPMAAVVSGGSGADTRGEWDETESWEDLWLH